jgi:hypothetical protein
MPIHDWTRVRSGRFHHFHQSWIVAICDALNTGILPAGYFALAEQSVGLIPDVMALEELPSNGIHGPRTSGGGGRVAIADLLPRTKFVREAEEDIYARKADRIAIRQVEDDRMVAVIEIVSPGNKGSKNALRAFVEKAIELIQGGIHLLVVDVFPPSKRDPYGIHKANWDEIREEDFEPDKPLTLAAYSAGLVKKAFVEPVAVGDLLPDMPLFLTPNDWVPVPLESTYQKTWNALPAPVKRPLEPPATT